jgi:hypothetical protein
MYQITVAYDGKPIHFNKNYADALEAFSAFLSFVDWGFANEYSTVNLMTPTGKMYTKTFYREGRKVVSK